MRFTIRFSVAKLLSEFYYPIRLSHRFILRKTATGCPDNIPWAALTDNVPNHSLNVIHLDSAEVRLLAVVDLVRLALSSDDEQPFSVIGKA